MFTGIIESTGEVLQVDASGDNRVLTIQSSMTPELKVDQSVSHNGVCLTVSSLVGPESYQVVAVPETIRRSNLDALSKGDLVNLERSMVLGGRLDGHLVQGHVDQTAVCHNINKLDGSWEMVFKLNSSSRYILIEKGSICVNGISLTCYNITETSFQVSIIPYTFDHTNFKTLKPGHQVNLEFDIIGKYLQALLKKN